jgi:hypothetical protein
MRFAVAVLLVLSTLALPGCESKSEKADQMMREFNAAHPDYQQKCAPLYKGTLGYPDIPSPYASLMKVTPEEKAAYEAKVKARQAECKPLDEQYDKLLRAKSQDAQTQH